MSEVKEFSPEALECKNVLDSYENLTKKEGNDTKLYDFIIDMLNGIEGEGKELSPIIKNRLEQFNNEALFILDGHELIEYKEIEKGIISRIDKLLLGNKITIFSFYYDLGKNLNEYINSGGEVKIKRISDIDYFDKLSRYGYDIERTYREIDPVYRKYDFSSKNVGVIHDELKKEYEERVKIAQEKMEELKIKRIGEKYNIDGFTKEEKQIISNLKKDGYKKYTELIIKTEIDFQENFISFNGTPIKYDFQKPNKRKIIERNKKESCTFFDSIENIIGKELTIKLFRKSIITIEEELEELGLTREEYNEKIFRELKED